MLEDLQILGENTFLVKSSHSGNREYLVDMNSGMCQCPIGSNGDCMQASIRFMGKKISQILQTFCLFLTKTKE